MDSLSDVNLLVALCDDWHTHHARAKEWLATVSPPERVVLCRVSQLGLLRLLTNPVIMKEHACTTAAAWQVYDTLMSDSRFVFRPEPPTLETRLREFTRGFSFSPKLWQDAYLAAFAREAELRMVTFDKGFRQFEGLDCSVLTT